MYAHVAKETLLAITGLWPCRCLRRTACRGKKTEGTGEERASRVPPEATGRAGTFLGSPYISRSTAAPSSGPMAPDRRRPNDLTWPLKIR